MEIVTLIMDVVLFGIQPILDYSQCGIVHSIELRNLPSEYPQCFDLFYFFKSYLYAVSILANIRLHSIQSAQFSDSSNWFSATVTFSPLGIALFSAFLPLIFL